MCSCIVNAAKIDETSMTIYLFTLLFYIVCVYSVDKL